MKGQRDFSWSKESRNTKRTRQGQNAVQLLPQVGSRSLRWPVRLSARSLTYILGIVPAHLKDKQGAFRGRNRDCEDFSKTVERKDDEEIQGELVLPTT